MRGISAQHRLSRYFYDNVKYIHVARDGRDSVVSWHHQLKTFTETHREQLSKIGVEDPVIGRPYPLIPEEPAAFFRLWLTTPVVEGQADGLPSLSFFDFEASFWAERHRPNFLFVHYQDLLDDRDGEMRRIAHFLDIEPDERVWPLDGDQPHVAAASVHELLPALRPGAGTPCIRPTRGRCCRAASCGASAGRGGQAGLQGALASTPNLFASRRICSAFSQWFECSGGR